MRAVGLWRPSVRRRVRPSPRHNPLPGMVPTGTSSDVIRWPAILTDSRFAAEREQIEAPFRRALSGGPTPTVADYRTIIAASEQMKVKLRGMAPELIASEYLVLDSFLDQLEGEGRGRIEELEARARSPRRTRLRSRRLPATPSPRPVGMTLPSHKTKIVATIGPASESPEMLERLIRAGMNVARLNFSHGDFSEHAERIARIRAAERATGLRVAIMADLPGPKMRLGKIDPEPIQLRPGDRFTLTSEDMVGTPQRVSMSFERLPQVVKPGDRLFLNDGLVQLVVEEVAGNDVQCRSPWAANSARARASTCRASTWASAPSPTTTAPCLEFALENGVDAVSQSFVETAADIEAVRAAAKAVGKQPVPHRQDRTGRRPGALRRNPQGRRRHHGGARRPRRRGADRGDRPDPEAAHRQGEPGGQAGHHRHADARVDGVQPAADAGRGHRRGQRHSRRHRLRHALRRVGDGKVSRGGRGACWPRSPRPPKRGARWRD